MTLRLWGIALLLALLGVAGCAGSAPAPAPVLAPPVPLAADFPPTAEREHIALRQELGLEGHPGERRQTLYQFADHPFNLGPGWCATTPAQMQDNWTHLHWTLTVDGVQVPLADYPLTDGERVTGICRLWLVVTPGLPPGEHSVVYTLILDAPIGDGTFRYPPGEYITRLRIVSFPRQTPPDLPRPTVPTILG